MIVPLKESADFLGKYHRVVTDIYHRPVGPMTETELYHLIDEAKGDTLSEETRWILKRLLDLKVVTVSEAEQSYELSSALRGWLDYLHEHAEPVSEDSIRAHHRHVSRLTGDLREALRTGDAVAGRAVVRELVTAFRRFTADIEITHSAVIKEALEVKNAQGQISAHERYVRINRLYRSYVEPVRRTVSVHGEMESTFEELEHLARRCAAAGFFRDPTFVEYQILDRVARARAVARAKLDDCDREVEPLFRRLRRETQILAGASRALAAVRAHGFAGSGLGDRFATVSFQIRQQAGDGLLAHLLRAVLRSSPPAAPTVELPSGTADTAEHRAAAFLREANETVGGQLPVADLLGHLRALYPEQRWENLMEAFSDLALNPELRTTFTGGREDRRTYHLTGATVRANPASLEPARTGV